MVAILDTGSTSYVRNTAAQQLGDLARSHHDEIPALLSRVYPNVLSSSWETRVAAAKALGNIIEHIPTWDPDGDAPIVVKEEPMDDDSLLNDSQYLSHLISFNDWSLNDLITSQHVLLANSGDQYILFKNNPDYNKLDATNKRLKTEFTQKLGLHHPQQQVKEEKASIKTEPASSIPASNSEEPDQLPQQPPKKMSARMKALAKRKAKTDKCTKSNSPVDLSQSTVSNSLSKKELASTTDNDKPQFDVTSQDNGSKLVVEQKKGSIDSNILTEHAKYQDKVWMLQGTYELFLKNLFDPAWEVRHGASLGLREIIKHQAIGAGRVYNKTKKENDYRNKRTLEDLTVRLLSVFAMDRFGDYVSDTVVAPVRENTAQVLAALLKYLDDELTLETYTSLCELIEQPQQQELQIKSEMINELKGVKQNSNKPMTIWEAKHGGLLGLRYFVSIKTDLLLSNKDILTKTSQIVLSCLCSQGDDDVQTVAAATLVPITGAIVEQSSKLLLKELVEILWTVLGDGRDDLSAATGAIMDLLAKLCQHEEILNVMKEMSFNIKLESDDLDDKMDIEEGNKNWDFSNLVPRLYPFLRHSISSVRKAVLRTLLAFLEINDVEMRHWILNSNGLLIRLIFQNILFEQNAEVRELNTKLFEKLIEEAKTINVETIFGVHLLPLLDLLTTPVGLPRFGYSMNPSNIMKPSGSFLSNNDLSLSGINIKNFNSDSSIIYLIEHGIQNETNKHDKEGSPIVDDDLHKKNKRKRKATNLESNHTHSSDTGIPDSEYDLYVNIDAPIINGDITLVGLENIWLTRLEGAKSMGYVLSQYENIDILKRHLKYFEILLNSSFSTHRTIITIILTELFKILSKKNIEQYDELSQVFIPQLLSVATHPSELPFFRESVPLLRSLRSQCTQLLAGFQAAKVPSSKLKTLAILVSGEREAGPGAFGVSDAESLIGDWFDTTFKNLPSVARIEHSTNLNSLKSQVQLQLDEVKDEVNDREHVLVSSSATTYICAMLLSKDGQLPSKLNPFIRAVMDAVKSVKGFHLQDHSGDNVTYLIEQLIKNGKHNIVDKMVKNLCGFLCVDPVEVPEYLPNKEYDGIMTLKKDGRNEESLEAAGIEVNDVLEDHDIRYAIVKRRGGKLVLEKLIEKFGVEIFKELTNLKSLMIDPLEVLKNDESEIDDKSGQNIIDSFELIKCILPKLDISLTQDIFDKIDLILLGLKSSTSVWRFSAAKCFASMVKTSPSMGFQLLVKNVLPLLQNANAKSYREGAIEAIYHVVQEMGATILPYVVFLIVPVLGRMSDSIQDIRLLATTTFAQIIKLVPLEAGIPDPVDMSEDLLAERAQEREFLQQMMDPTTIKSFELPVSIKATLRKYQQEGVNWLHFLNEYHLHGILCDDMGLGKTLQTICIIASDHHLRAKKFAETGSIESKRLSTLIVCPPSLTGHWEQEINEYSPFMKVLVYAGPPSVRASLKKDVENRDSLGIDVIVTSYDVLRNDSEFLTDFNFNYCVLDEGHIIKNSTTRLTKVVKCIKAEHRLVLSGTPIQNNVLELWSLFDFLMPGFLGTEKQFQEKFAKPIAQSRTSKGKREQERGALALESLHKQVLPFMLRRLKEDVLSDLPPKIIQDYYCQMSNLQKQLYKDFIKKQKGTITKDIEQQQQQQDGVATSGEGNGKQHVFQVLQYMRKLCNHPSLVLTAKHPQYNEVTEHLKKYNKTLNDIENAPKLMALKTLLKECGIGLAGDDFNVIAQHRVLIFFQMKDMMDIVENELLKKHMPKVTYLRMDGATDPRFRQELVKKFNGDPSIDLMLLTTKVGGLGLNLTSADTVIFVEHDWNPMNDLQAMDRTHRLGQKKVVNVYRLITKDTLEEKIMGLQKFKMDIANTIVNQQNSGLASMDTHQLLDLFDSNEDEDAVKTTTAQHGVEDEISGVVGGAGSGAVRELPALWDEREYEEEYNMEEFIKSLK